jgi:hypothetical protein
VQLLSFEFLSALLKFPFISSPLSFCVLLLIPIQF